MVPQQKTLKYDIHVFTGIIALLIIIGLVFIYSSSAVYALERYHNAHFFLKKHIYGIILGIGALLMGRLLPLRAIQHGAPLFFVTILVLTGLTMLSPFAVRIHGSSRWLNLAGFVFQPSELLKIAFVMYLAYLLAKKESHIRSLTRTYIPLLCIMGIVSVLLLRQPDFGMAITIALTAFILMFIAHVPLPYLGYTLSAFIPIVVALVVYKPYRLKRILTFLNPWSDPQGSGFQIIQSLIAIGSGGVWGVGIARSQQKFFYLPMQHTDFIFSIIAEETGFIGSAILIGLYAGLLYLGIKIAWQLHNQFCTYTTLGFTIMTTLQVIINLAVATGLAPTKGVGLPFVSYGNTALICNLFMVGVIVNGAYAARKEIKRSFFNRAS
ncbi:putative lipid II flippase FtsW [Candidatus Dependentiae bacterium]|nr:putative lipid II flippase FtsW [Candidatus Dependentiae bacterium]